MFSSGRDSPEMEEAALPVTHRPARPQAGLAAGLAAAGSVSPPAPSKELAAQPSGLAAAQAIAARISQNIRTTAAGCGDIGSMPTVAAAGRSASLPTGATTTSAIPGFAPVPVAAGAAELVPTEAKAEDAAAAALEAAEAETAATGAVSMPAKDQVAGRYDFTRRYTRASLVPVAPDASGLQSIDRYENLGLVGRGAFNKIYKARNRETGEVVALKAMQLAALEQAGQVQGDEGIPLEMMREMSILLSLRHPNIVTVHEVVVDPTQMFLVMELVDFDLGLLIEHMKAPFSEQQVKCLALQLLSALSAVHENFVLHRDLKQTNLLLDKNGVLKLCDFGLARRASSSSDGTCTPNVTSLWYRAPEILLGATDYTSAVDMWSFGCIMAEWLQLGEPLVQGTGDLDQINCIFKLLGTPSESSWPAYGSLQVVQSATLPFVESHTISLGSDGSLVKLPKNLLRKRFPAEGYVPPAPGQPPPPPQQHRTTALSDAGFELLNGMLTCNPEQRATAASALQHPWFTAEPLPAPLSRFDIRQLRRQRDEAISSGAHQQAIAQQRAQAASKVAQEQAAAIAAAMRERMGGRMKGHSV